jgi:hypothetical protein
MLEKFFLFFLGLPFMIVMAWLVWESTVMISEKKFRSAGEKDSKKKHMDDIL